MARFRGRRRTFRKKRGGWRNMRLGSLASKAYKTAMYLKGLINVEKKFFDTNNTATDVINTGVIEQLTNIAEGSDYNNRTGRSVKATSNWIQLEFRQHASATQTHLRYLIVIDKENQGTTPAVTDVLKSANVYSPMNIDNGSRFKVLLDKRFSFDSAGTTICQRKHFKKLFHHIKWKGTNGTDEGEGQLYIVLVSNEATNKPGFSYTNRVRFIDN